MAEHRACPHCGTEGPAAQPTCAACGRRVSVPPRLPAPPWPIYPAGMVLLALCIAGCAFLIRREPQLWSQDRFSVEQALLFAALLLAGGQVGLYYARRQDRRYWAMRRAPQLPVAETDPGDAAWVCGTVDCDAPLTLPYSDGLQCVYYHYRISSRGENGGSLDGEARSVDFQIVDGEHSISIPSSVPAFDAPHCLDTDLDNGMRITATGILIGSQVSACGHVTGDRERRILDHLDSGVRALVTHRQPGTYLTDLSEAARAYYAGGWSASIAGVAILFASALGKL